MVNSLYEYYSHANDGHVCWFVMSFGTHNLTDKLSVFCSDVNKVRTVKAETTAKVIHDQSQGHPTLKRLTIKVIKSFCFFSLVDLYVHICTVSSIKWILRYSRNGRKR